jgi:hypothetical protein
MHVRAPWSSPALRLNQLAVHKALGFVETERAVYFLKPPS